MENLETDFLAGKYKLEQIFVCMYNQEYNLKKKKKLKQNFFY